MSATHRLPHGFSFLALTLNQADRTAAMWKQGLITAIATQEILEGLGFFAVDFRQISIVARLNDWRFELDGTFYSLALEAA